MGERQNGEVTETSDRFVTAPPDPTGALVTAVGYRTERPAPVDHRGLPSPFLTFIVSLDEPVVLAERDGERRLDVVVAGLHTDPEIIKMPRLQSGVQAAVHPLAARRLFGVPAAELARTSLEGEDVLGRAAPRLRERLAEASGWDQRFAILTAETELGRADAPPPGHIGRPRAEVVEAWRLLTVSRGRIRIAELAGRVFLSRRRLSTLFAAEFGVTPKEAARTMRFTHAISRIGEGVRASAATATDRAPAAAEAMLPGGVAPSTPLDLARVAAECGYADQSHLAREFGALAGISPSGWIAEEFPNIQAGGHRYARDWEA
jgi:AraC-like DNA-binding protein